MNLGGKRDFKLFLYPKSPFSSLIPCDATPISPEGRLEPNNGVA